MKFGCSSFFHFATLLFNFIIFYTTVPLGNWRKKDFFLLQLPRFFYLVLPHKNYSESSTGVVLFFVALTWCTVLQQF